jgi:hypothetical protein
MRYFIFIPLLALFVFMASIALNYIGQEEFYAQEDSRAAAPLPVIKHHTATTTSTTTSHVQEVPTIY